jgi:hypothetical protein
LTPVASGDVACAGLVPFLQIAEKRHVRTVTPPPRTARVRLYFSSAAARTAAMAEIEHIRREMVQTALDGAQLLAQIDAGNVRVGSTLKRGAFKRVSQYAMEPPTIGWIDDHAPRTPHAARTASNLHRLEPAPPPTS